MNMTRSNRISVKSIATVESLVLWKLSSAQVSVAGDHVERIYGIQVSRAGPKRSIWVEIENSPEQYL